MDFEQQNSLEIADAKKVDNSCYAISQGKLDFAESLLLGVISNTPSNYLNEFPDGENSIAIKFWDQNAFLNYITWQKKTGYRKIN